VPQDRSDSVSGLSNFMRNIGSSAGTSLVQTVVARRSQFHLARMVDHLTVGSPALSSQVQGLAYAIHARNSGLGWPDAQLAALGQLYRYAVAQAYTLSYIDAYFLLGLGSAIMLFLSFFLKANDPRNTEQQAGH
jgi:DHA2 family multidrug resistance protein